MKKNDVNNIPSVRVNLVPYTPPVVRVEDLTETYVDILEMEQRLLKQAEEILDN